MAGYLNDNSCICVSLQSFQHYALPYCLEKVQFKIVSLEKNTLGGGSTCGVC